MPRKSNKTSYVMNLITNGEPAEEEQAQEGQSQQDIGNSQGEKPAVTEEGQSGQVNAQQTAPSVSEPSAGKIVVVDEDEESEKLSEEIKSQLELQLEAELEEMAQAAESEAESTAEEWNAGTEPSAEEQNAPTESAVTEQNAVSPSADAGSAVQEEMQETETPISGRSGMSVPNAAGADVPEELTEQNIAPDTATETIKQSETIQETNIMPEEQVLEQEQDLQPETSQEESLQSEQPAYRMVNVMEQLVSRVDLDKYIEEYGVCKCARCRADVHALILTTLPSKYVVMNESSISPMLNFYESRRKTDIFTATLKACLEVKENPRHEGEAKK